MNIDKISMPGRGLIVLIYASLLFFPGLGQRDLNSSHEARAGQNAQSILDDNAWLMPRRFDLRPELQKPPLYYWLVALIGSIKGGQVDAWAVRLPSALSALGCVLAVWFLGEKKGRPLAGLLAALILASCAYFTWLARVARIDMPLTCAVTLALVCFELSRSENRLLWAWGGYTAIAIGILLKGPIALVLVFLVASIIRWCELAAVAKSLQGLKSLVRQACSPNSTLWWGIPWVLLLTVPWFIAADLATDHQFSQVFFWHHNLERGLGGAEDLAVKPWWFYFPRAVLDLLPWSVFVPIIAWLSYRASTDREAVNGLLWFSSILVFLSCMSFKRIDYLLPAYPGLALYLGSSLESLIQTDTSPKRQRGTLLAFISFVLAGTLVGWNVYVHAIEPRQESRWPYREVAHEIRKMTSEPIIFFRAEQHLLAFHIGRPIDTIMEWENLEVWANREFPVYFVMPSDCARTWHEHISHGKLEEVLRVDDWLPEPERQRLQRSNDETRHHQDRSLVVMRSCPTLK